ncbi:hypothetical protein AJ80_09217 [Polytolypa hystricis UAMH7299]|uniref:GABA permease n=1 Tax=Polytolypa hystricis (strain UAMH7299) TaxID=1447883 RepID=A0A2B7WLB6_POLH7|nr:hypothetical protein AJ80_09217 [Polytolypa hystricis UAMH7299]
MAASMAVSPNASSSDALGKASPHGSLNELSEVYDLEGTEVEEAEAPESKFSGHTKYDQSNMTRMGKRQEFVRNFRPLSALSFSILLQATWEFILISNNQGLINGGLAGLFWSFIWTIIGFMFVILSLAEMASMAPISGGQYHWVSEFASPKYQKALSYVTGWMSVLAWQAGAASGSFLTGTIIQGLISVNNPSYQPKDWESTLFVFAMVAIIYICNMWAAQGLPMIQNLLVVIHIFGFMAIISVFWVLSPHQTASAVFTEFRNAGGWPTMGIALMVGQVSAMFCSISADATAHMAEEVTDASRTVPMAITWGYISNVLLGIVMVVSFLFALPDVESALEDPTGFPFLYAFRNAVSPAGVNALTAIILLLVITSNIAFNASASRQAFSFARDNGLPFAEWLSAVHPKRHIPANAILASCIISILLALINLVSGTAYEAIVSLTIAALMATYIVSIACVLYRRIYHPELLPPARWNLGSTWGPIINIIALLYVNFAMFWSFWPQQRNIDATSFNFCIVIFMGVLILSILFYIFQGRKVYTGPVTSVEGRRGSQGTPNVE